MADTIPPVKGPREGPIPIKESSFARESQPPIDEATLEGDTPDDAHSDFPSAGVGQSRPSQDPKRNSNSNSASKIPSDGVAVVFQNRFVIVYVNYAGELYYLECPVQNEDARGLKPYVQKPVKYRKEGVKEPVQVECRRGVGQGKSLEMLPRVASVVWGTGREQKWRIFFINKDGLLDEVVFDSWTGDANQRAPKFVQGNLIQGRNRVADNSILAASADGSGFRVFFQARNESTLYVSHTTLSFGESWSMRAEIGGLGA